MRVLHLLRAPLGGAFRHVYDLANTQARQGIAVGVVCDDADVDPGVANKLRQLAVNCSLGVMRLPIPRLPGPADARAMRAVAAFARGRSPDILHGHGAKGGAYARLLARRIGAASVCTPHGGALHYSYSSPAGTAFLLLERALKSRTDAMIFESQYAKQTYQNKLGAITFPHRIIMNGLYEHEFDPVRSDRAAFDFLFIGEYRELKGIYVFVDALARLPIERDWRVLMVGSGPDESRLRARIAAAGLTDRVTVSGPIHPARAAFERARFVVAPSNNESMPYLILEAIAARMPLITTAVGGIPEVFGIHRQFLLPAGDDAALAARLCAVLDDPEQAAALAADLREHALAHLSVEQMTRNITLAYDELCGRHQRAGTLATSE